MGESIDHAKKEFLEAMYRSVEKMNECEANGNHGGALKQQAVQAKLRKAFEELQERET